MSLQERLPHDHAARTQALDPARSFLVQAPAGSGKTELLTDRILALLATVSKPEEIVAITFTRKAASEMHARVLAKLKLGEGPAPQIAHERRSWELARAALQRNDALRWNMPKYPARLAIRTIDSFCAGLVRSMPWLSELGGMPDIADDARTHYEAAARAALDLVDEYDAVRVLLAHMDVDVQAATEAIAGMLGQRDQWLPLLRHGSDRHALQNALAQTVEEDLAALAKAMPFAWEQALSAPARLAADALQASGGANKLEPLLDWDEALPIDAHALPQWQAVAHLLLTATNTLRSPKGVNKNLGFPAGCAYKAPFVDWLAAADPHAPWVQRLGMLRDTPNAEFTDAQWEILSAQLMTLALAVAQLRLRFAELGEVDFIEIGQRASLALGSAGDPGELLLKLDASIRHLLIDEFQDTSQSQLDLLRTLTAGWQDHDGRTLFLVGDPMQSIYRFRKAEVGLFLQVAQEGIGDVRPEFLHLTDNFRSQAGVVDWVNRTFERLLPDQNDAASGAIAYSPSTAFHPVLPDAAVTFHPAWACDGVVSADQQAEDIAVDLIRQALQAYPDSKKPVAVLVRARSHLEKLTRRLAQESISCRAVELVPLAARPLVSDLVQLVRALMHPGDRLAWLSVLRAPCCGLTLNAMHRLFGHDHTTPIPILIESALYQKDSAKAGARPATALTTSPQGSLFGDNDSEVVVQDVEPSCMAQQCLPASEYARFLQVAAVLLDKGNDSGVMPLAAWVESLWQRLGGAALYPGVSTANDAESLFQLIERLAPYGDLDLAAFDTGIARLFASPEAVTQGAAVEIMTMHKSKGLQFDTVILYGLHRAPRSDQAPLVRFEQSAGRVLFGPIKARTDLEADPISRYLGQREQRRASYEIDRLLYVAATRARKRLHLVANVTLDAASGQIKAPAAASLLGRLWPCLDPVTVPDRMDQAEPIDPNAPQLQGEPLRRIAAQGLSRLASQAGKQVNPGFAAVTPGVWSEQTEHPAWQLESGHEAAIGTLAHAWLARIGQDGLAVWSADLLAQHLPIMHRQLTRAGIPADQAAGAAALVLDTLQATLADERGRWLLSQAGARREWPLIDAAGKVSVIDLALSTENGWLIVDYKTGQMYSDETPKQFAARMRQRHADQLLRYCAQITALDGRAARAALYFPRVKAWIELSPSGRMP
jgi:ATP-dependent exoDNAse (exonuclease V) beta subunit